MSHNIRLPCSPVPAPQAPRSPFTQSNTSLFGQQQPYSSEVGTVQSQSPHSQSPARYCPHSQGAALHEDCPTTPGRLTCSHVFVLTQQPKDCESYRHGTVFTLFVMFCHAGHIRSSPAETPSNQKPRVKKKMSKSSAFKRDIQGGKQVHSHSDSGHIPIAKKY